METWEEGTVARENGGLRNAASLWGKQPSLHLGAPKALGIKMAQRRLSGESSVGALPSSSLLPGFWSMLPANRNKGDLLGHWVPAETVSEGLTLLDASTICPACATASCQPTSLSHTIWHQHRKVGAPIPSPNHFQGAETWTWLVPRDPAMVAHTCNASSSLEDEVRESQ